MSNQTQKEPRSVRLTKAHRTDMVDAVMQEWKKQNPVPKVDFVSFLKSAIKHALQHDQSFIKRVENTRIVKETQESLPNLVGPHSKPLNYSTLGDFTLSAIAVNNEGVCETLSSYDFVLPVDLADELGIPYLVSTTKYFSDKNDYYGHVKYWNNDDYRRRFADYIQSGAASSDDNKEFEPDFVETVELLNTASIQLEVPADFPGFRDMKKAERQVRLWEEEQKRQRSEVMDILDQFNSTKQIRDGWPEMVPYMPPHIADPERAIRLPALAVSRLNERLGI